MNMANIAFKSATIQTTVKRVVIDLFEQIASDPDYGLDLQNRIKERLKKFDNRRAPAQRLTSLAELKKKLA